MYLACTFKSCAVRQVKLSQLAVINGPYWERSLLQSTLHVMSHKSVDLHSSITIQLYIHILILIYTDIYITGDGGSIIYQ